jgi:uncharacterized protein YraI
MKHSFFILLWLFVASFCFAQDVQYTTENLNLRAYPSTNGRFIIEMPKGSEVNVLMCNIEWCAVEFGDKVGFAASRYLSSMSPSTYTPSYVLPQIYTPPSQTTSTSRPNYNSSGATAVCRDGTLSYSHNRRGTCSHHGGVARWM